MGTLKGEIKNLKKNLKKKKKERGGGWWDFD